MTSHQEKPSKHVWNQNLTYENKKRIFNIYEIKVHVSGILKGSLRLLWNGCKMYSLAQSGKFVDFHIFPQYQKSKL